MKLLRSLGGSLSVMLLLGLLLLSSVPAGAQTLNSLFLERTITTNNILTTVTPTIPAPVLAAVASGAIEVREQIVFNPQTNTVTSTFFLVPTGSPVPTNLALLPFTSFAGVITTSITNILFNTTPVPAVTIVGKVGQSTQTAYGSALGGVSTLSFGYSSDTPPKISNVIETNAGYIVIYSASAQGTLSITQPPGGGGGGGGAGITVKVNGVTFPPGAVFQTVTNTIELDAAGSTTSNSGATLDFDWTLAPGSPAATIARPRREHIALQLDAGHGTYVIRLRVFDTTGASVTVDIQISFV